MSEHQGWDLNVVVVVYTIHYKTIFNILIEWPLQWNDHCIDVNTNLADFTGVVVSSFCCFSNTTNVWGFIHVLFHHAISKCSTLLRSLSAEYFALAKL